jgi:enamidase
MRKHDARQPRKIEKGRIMRSAVVNLGAIVSGDLAAPFASGDTVILDGGRIARVGTASAAEIESCDVVIDAGGATAIPGLIDSHVHITFGDYTPRQKTVGFLESYLHGGITTAVSASEVHVPGRPTDPDGVKALAIAAQRCFANYRPGGMRVVAGSIILEPGVSAADLQEVAAKGVCLAKAGFGSFASPFDYIPLIGWARAAGLITTVHTGGASIPGSSPITAEHLLAMRPHVSFHVNGGPVAMPDRDFERLVKESDMALQLCTAGNLRTALLCTALVERHGALDRLLIATDTPTGSGIMPLGVLYTVSHVASLGKLAPEIAIAAATGNNARHFNLSGGYLREGTDADLVIVDAPLGGSQGDALSALANGDIPAIAGVISNGVPRFVGRSRNTPPSVRRVQVVSNRVPFDFSSSPH